MSERKALEEKAEKLRFREGLERLERIVSSLEGDDLELEEALDRYEEGLRLYQRLSTILAEAEKRIEVLGGERAGTFLWKEFKGATEGAAGGAENGKNGLTDAERPGETAETP
jgi:exodeoxyribonuclease VII small subunit